MTKSHRRLPVIIAITCALIGIPHATLADEDVEVDPNPTVQDTAPVTPEPDPYQGPLGPRLLKEDTMTPPRPTDISLHGEVTVSPLLDNFGRDFRYESSLLTAAVTGGVTNENGTWVTSRTSVPGRVVHINHQGVIDNVINMESRGAWSAIVSNGQLVVGANSPGSIYVYDELTGDLLDSLKLETSEIVMALEPYDESTIWVGTYSPNGGRLLKLDQRRMKLTELNRWPEPYIRSLTQMGDLLYIGLGAPTRLVSYDGKSFEDVDYAFTGAESVYYSMASSGDYMALGTSPNARLAVLKKEPIDSGEYPTPGEDQPEGPFEMSLRDFKIENSTAVDQMVFYNDYLLFSARPSGTFYALDVSDPYSTPVALGTPLEGEEYRDFSIVNDVLYAVGGSGTITEVDLTPLKFGFTSLSMSTRNILDLQNSSYNSPLGSESSPQGTTWRNGNLLSFGHWVISETDPETGDYSYVRIPGEVKTHAQADDTLFLGVYPYARLYKWNEGAAEPTLLTRIPGGQSRPRAMAVLPDGDIIISTRPTNGNFGGALTVIDPNTGGVVRQVAKPFKSHTGSAMLRLDESLYVGTEQYGEGVQVQPGSSPAAFVSKITQTNHGLFFHWESTPIEDANAITSLISLPKGKETWIAGSTNNGWVFVLEADTGELVMKSKVGRNVSALANVDGRIFAVIDGGLNEGDIGLASVRFARISDATTRWFMPDETGRRISVIATKPLGQNFVHRYVLDKSTRPERIGGRDRFHTAAGAARIGFGKSSTAILVNSMAYADQAVAMPLSKAMNAPLLLTSKDTVPKTTLDALEKLGVSKVTIVGGKGVVSKSVVGQLKALGYRMERMDGSNRFETAVSVADQIEQMTGPARNIYVATGMDYADAVVAAPAAAKTKGVVVYSSDRKIGDATTSFLRSHPQIPITAVGGPARKAVSSAGFESSAVVGPNRYSTSVAVAKQIFPEAQRSYVANGLAYSDAVVASALASVNDSPTILNPVNRIPKDFDRYLEAAKERQMVVYLVGGTGVLNANLENQIRGYISKTN